MGYTTDFTGAFTLDRPLSPEHAAYLRKFAETRRVKRDAAIAETLPDPIRVAAGLPVGHDGAYFVGGVGDFGQGDDASVIDNNTPPGLPGWRAGDYAAQMAEKDAAISKGAQPGLWCQWVPTEDGTGIEWDGGEKFYAYGEWLGYIVRHFLKPWGYTLNGKVRFQGEDSDDRGAVICTSNTVTVKQDQIVPA